MSYMEYFQNNLTGSADDKIDAIEGTCTAMCPDDEVTLRVREKMVHVLEVVGGEHRLVKCYARSAADTNLAVLHNIRPLHTLVNTVHYLLFEVTKRTDVSSLVKYNFITDRLRAVRQEMIIQNFCPKNCIVLLEPMIRFHVYFGYFLKGVTASTHRIYEATNSDLKSSDALVTDFEQIDRLCELPVQDYSPTLNHKFLLECLKMCLRCYDEIDKQSTEDEDMGTLISNFFGCSLEDKNQTPVDRGLMEALYTLVNLFDEHPLYRFCKLPPSLRVSPTVELAFRIAIARLHGYYFKVCSLIQKLCPLGFCAVSLHLPAVQREAVRVLHAAYSSRNGSVPVEAVRRWVGRGGQRACAHYGLLLEGGAVLCRRGALRDVDTLPPRRCTPVHLEAKMELNYVLTYTQYNTSSNI